MTNKEAIEILKPLTEYSVDENGIGTFPMVSTPLQAEALDLAIKALEEAQLDIKLLKMDHIVVQPEVIKALADCVVDMIKNIDWDSID